MHGSDFELHLFPRTKKTRRVSFQELDRVVPGIDECGHPEAMQRFDRSCRVAGLERPATIRTSGLSRWQLYDFQECCPSGWGCASIDRTEGAGTIRRCSTYPCMESCGGTP